MFTQVCVRWLCTSRGLNHSLKAVLAAAVSDGGAMREPGTTLLREPQGTEAEGTWPKGKPSGRCQSGPASRTPSWGRQRRPAWGKDVFKSGGRETRGHQKQSDSKFKTKQNCFSES